MALVLYGTQYREITVVHVRITSSCVPGRQGMEKGILWNKDDSDADWHQLIEGGKRTVLEQGYSTAWLYRRNNQQIMENTGILLYAARYADEN